MNILIADDSKIFRDRVKDLLRNLICVKNIYETSNGVDAFMIIQNKIPQLALLDIRMPLMTGIEVLRKVKHNNINTKIFIMTSYPYKQYREKSLSEGADYFISKSDDFEKLTYLITEINEVIVLKKKYDLLTRS